jgi:hypothetical protein
MTSQDWDEMKTENAKITSTFLGREDHGIMTFFLYLEYDRAGQGFGGYSLRNTRFAMKAIDEVLKVVGVNSWEELPNKYIRVESERGTILRRGSGN